MAAGFDGTIKIDTRVDAKGLNTGMKSISNSLGGVLRAAGNVAKTLGAAFIGGSIINGITSVIGEFDLMSSSIGGSVKSLSESFGALKGAFVQLIITALAPLIPFVIIVVQWLTTLLTIVAQIIGALFGFQAGMSGVAKSASGAGGAIKKTAKEAKGALATFDQISVLAVPEPEADAGGGGGGGGGGVPGLPAIDPALLKSVQEFKDKLLAFLKPVIDAFDRLKKNLEPLGKTIWEGLKWAWDNILVPLGTWVITDAVPAFLDLLGAGAKVLNEALIALQPLGIWLWENFLKPLGEWTGAVIIDALKWLTERLNELSDWIKENPEKFQAFVLIIAALVAAWWLANLAVAAWTLIAGLGTVATAAFAAVMAFLTSPVFLVFLAIVALIAIIVLLVKNWDWVKEKALEVWKFIKLAWSAAGEWFKKNVAEPIKNGFTTALDSIKQGFENTFMSIKNFVYGIVNSIIDMINGMINAVVGGINAIIAGANTVGSLVPGFSAIGFVTAPQIPHLATGAVIPANSQFMAVLGDQKSGRNIEAPEGLIRQIVREETGKMQADIRISFSGNLASLVRELKPYIDRENVRIGNSLVKGTITV